MNKFIHNNCVVLLGYFTLLASVQHTWAGQTIYQLKESNGTTLLTNKMGSYNHLKVEKKTYYPDSNMHSYSNWGKNEAAVLPSYSKNRDAFDPYIRQAAQTHGVSESLIKAVIHTESGFNTQARSPVGALGLMQLMPATAKRFNVSNAYDPQQNIHGGAKYLAWLMKRFHGNTDLVLASYNAGEGNVDKYGGIPPFRETKDYVRRVTSRLNNLYANGLGQSANNSSFTAQASSNTINLSSNHSNSTYLNNNSATIQYSTRPIIVSDNNSYTDAPAGSFSTANAIATAHLKISQ